MIRKLDEQTDGIIVTPGLVLPDVLPYSPQPRSQDVFPFLNLKKGKSPGNDVV